MDFDPNVFLLDLLRRTSPLLVPSIPAAMGTVKGLTSAIKVFVNRNKSWNEKLRGNVVQSLAGVVSVTVATGQAHLLGMFKVGLTVESVTGTLLLALIAWMGAMGFHDLLKDQNKATGTGQ